MATERKIFYLNYDLDASTYKYGRVKGEYPGFYGITTNGPGAGYEAVVPGSAPFAPVRIGDFIWVYKREADLWIKKKITSKADDDHVGFNGSVTVADTTAWYFLPFDIGTTDADGAHSLQPYKRAWVEFDWTLADSLDISIQVRGRYPAAKWTELWTGTYAIAAVPPSPIEIMELVGSVRVGVKGTSTFANTDDISIYLTGQFGARP